MKHTEGLMEQLRAFENTHYLTAVAHTHTTPSSCNVNTPDFPAAAAGSPRDEKYTRVCESKEFPGSGSVLCVRLPAALSSRWSFSREALHFLKYDAAYDCSLYQIPNDFFFFHSTFLDILRLSRKIMSMTIATRI